MNASTIYHNIFDYSLAKKELEKWETGKSVKYVARVNPLEKVGREKFRERKKRELISREKLKIAKRAGEHLAKIPTVKLVAVTGSLSMMNAKVSSDIDLMIVTKKGSLWTTRLVSYLFLKFSNFQLRKPKDKKEKDMLCLNIWLDESHLVFKKQNIFTAHEIAQIKPLVNKDHVYERLLWENRWILDYWPNAVRIKNKKIIIHDSNFLLHFVEKIAFFVQYQYMKSKITRELITPTRALFHPNDLSKNVILELQKQGVKVK